jgi:mannose-6-phosphate isomerase-like protein (cupin superfamily)
VRCLVGERKSQKSKEANDYRLTGAIRLYSRAEQPGAEEVEIKLAAGTAVIVPRGQPHRIELDVPSDIMTVTVTRGSSLEARSKA